MRILPAGISKAAGGGSIHIARMYKEDGMLNQYHGDMQPPPSPEVPDSPGSPLIEMGGRFAFPSPPPDSPLVRLEEVLSSPSPDVGVIEVMPAEATVVEASVTRSAFLYLTSPTMNIAVENRSVAEPGRNVV